MMPGKVRIAKMVLGAALTLMWSLPVLAQSPGAGEPRVRVMSGPTRISGRLIAVDAETVTVVSDADRDRIVHVPLSRITEAAVSDGRRPRTVAVLTGVGAGIAAGYFGFLVGLSGCADVLVFGCSHSGIRASQGLGVATGSFIGVTTTYHFARERWRTVPVESLRELSAPSAR